MTERRSSNLKVWTPLLFSLIMIFGMILGFNLRDSLRNKRDFQSIVTRNDRLEQIIDLINERYVDSIRSDNLYKDAVEGILSHLDPHTVYITPDELQGVNEDLEGSFFGIGVEFSIVRDTIQVTSVIPGGPAEKAGVDVGDQLIKVEDSVVAGTGITSARIIRLLRGKQHSKVLVTLKSSMNSQSRKVVIERDAIPLYSVDAAILINDTTGYIKIDRFSATTYDEFMEALKTLKSKGAVSLVLDLRQNPGGYLNAATLIADEFLDGDKLIVYTKGRRSPKMEYRAGAEGLFEKGRLAILVDESSASASEVLAGAVQDWDRGIIIGRRTFGKGLVQEQFELGDGSALRLTIARYYTPSGRSIQRSYAKGRKQYDEDAHSRLRISAADTAGAEVQTDTSRFFTGNKRVVYGGGGITPDIIVDYDSLRMSTALIHAVISEEFQNTVWTYFLRNRKALAQYRDAADFSQRFVPAPLMQHFEKAAVEDSAKRFRSVLSNPVTRAYFQTYAKAQLARYLFRTNGYYTITSKEDRVVQKALEVLGGRNYSAIIRR